MRNPGEDAATAIEDRSIFTADAGRLVPTPLARGPWYPNSQHGSAMLGLLARAVESHEAERPMQVVRLVADLARAAPLQAVRTPSRCLRSGKNVEIVEASIELDGKVFATAQALRIRVADVDVSHHENGRAMPPPYGPPPSRDGRSLLMPLIEGEAFHHAVDIRPTREPAERALWLRLRCPLVAGEPLSPLVRTAALADWSYSVPTIASEIRRGEMLPRTVATINPDAALHIHRPLVGEWLCMDADVHYGPHGAGSANARLYDKRGSIGHTSQSILIRALDEQPLRVCVGKPESHGRQSPQSDGGPRQNAVRSRAWSASRCPVG